MFHSDGNHDDNLFGRMLLNSVSNMTPIEDQMKQGINDAEEQIVTFKASVIRYQSCTDILTEDLCLNHTESHAEAHEIIKRLGGMIADHQAAIAEREFWIDQAKKRLEEIANEDASTDHGNPGEHYHNFFGK